MTAEELETLQLLLPAPDDEFVATAIDMLRMGQEVYQEKQQMEVEGEEEDLESGAADENGKDKTLKGGKLHATFGVGDKKTKALSEEDTFPSLTELQKDGIPDYDQFEEMTQAVGDLT